MTQLVRRSGSHEPGLKEQRARLVEIESLLSRDQHETTRLRAELDAFRLSYYLKVGTLYEQLDALEEAIAEAELGELSAQVGESRRPERDPEPPRPSAAPPRFTSDAIRKLFRDVAKAIHPDLALDDSARGRRGELMAEANRAYADRDEEQLRLILKAWASSPEAVEGHDPIAAQLRVMRRIAEVEERLAVVHAERDALKASALWELKARVDEATAQGRDLIADMVRRLKRDIMVATNRLAAMRPPD